MMAAAIKTINLSKHFGGIKAVDNLSVEIPASITTGLIGPNGSGKTTLMNVLTGIYTPEEGEIEVSGNKYNQVEITNLRNLKIARTFQDSRLVPQLSVADNLLLPIAENSSFKSFFEISAKDKKEKMHQILKLINLEDSIDKKGEELSYGQRKLLEIGRSLIQDADIYFFDEPFTGLFPEIVEKITNIFNMLKEQRKSLVIIEHNVDIIEKLCDYVIVLDYGKLLAEGKPEEVLKNKKVQEAYLGF